jgi:hypothetical protein
MTAMTLASPADAPAATVHEVAVLLDGVVAVAVRHGTASSAWQTAVARFLDRINALDPQTAEIALRVGPGTLVEADTRDGELHAHAWHDAWRDGLRGMRWRAPVDPVATGAVLRALCGPADAYHATALTGGDLSALRAWAGANRDQDVVTQMLHARGDAASPVIVAVDPTLPTGGPLREAFGRWTTPPRPEASRALNDAVAAGVEAPLRPGIPPLPPEHAQGWRDLAARLQALAPLRSIRVLEERTHAAEDDPATLTTEWLARIDEALASDDLDTAWAALEQIIDAHDGAHARHPKVIRAIRDGLSEARRSEALARCVALAPPARAAAAARWLVVAPRAATEAVSRALAAAHEPERALALEDACLRFRAAGTAFTVGDLYRAHVSAPASVALWAVDHLVEHHAEEPATRETLREALGHPDPDVQQRALVALGGDPSRATREALHRALGSSRRDIVAHALEELLQLADDGARDAIFARIRDPGYATLPAATRIMLLDAAARLEGDATADWMAEHLAARGWFLPREQRERQTELRQVLTALGTPWARAVLARGETP